MKKINYKVNCDATALNKKIKKETKYLEKQISLIILKRRELNCYEKCKTNSKY